MSDRYESRQAIANKIDWEGGLESFLQYGFNADQVPEGDTALQFAAGRMLMQWKLYEEASRNFENLLPEPS